MLIGTFFSWTGYHLLNRLALLDRSLPAYAPALLATPEWTDADLVRVRSSLVDRRFDLHVTPADLTALRPFLHDRAEFMIRLLENPMILEHQSFTELLRAVFHLIEEAEFRTEFDTLPPSDLAHLTADCDRVYRRLVIEWIDHLRYLRQVLPVPLLARGQDEPVQSRGQPDRHTGELSSRRGRRRNADGHGHGSAIPRALGHLRRGRSAPPLPEVRDREGHGGENCRQSSRAGGRPRRCCRPTLTARQPRGGGPAPSYRIVLRTSGSS